MRFPALRPMRQTVETTGAFMGYNHQANIAANEWYDAQNVSPRCFPLFAPRAPRGVVKQLAAPAGILARDALVWVDGSKLYINGLAVAGLELLVGEDHVPKQLVSMGAYIIIMPDKKYVNTANLADYGSIDAQFSFTGDVVLTPARVDGADLPLDNVPVGTAPPQNPLNGAYWVDTSGETHILKQYSATSGTWTQIPSVYTKIALPGVGAMFQKQDGVEIAGLAYGGTDAALKVQVPALNGSKVIEAIAPGYIIVSGLLSRVYTAQAATVSVKRQMPDMDFVIESENRLWGCKYGLVDGKTVNEIYASALGDFKNWRRYAGLSTDSYAVSVGTDGKFTGAIAHLGYPLFFKETCLHKLYGNMPANYRLETVDCRGVQQGSHLSLALVNEVVFYKGRTEILAYDGSLPQGIGQALGTDTYRHARAGAYQDLYYISMQDGAGAWHLFVYDTRKRLWYREDNTRAMAFAQLDDDLYFIDEGSKTIVAALGKSGAKQGPVAFSATSGIIGYTQKDHKYVSRLNIRAAMEAGATLQVALRYNSAGEWVAAGQATGSGLTRSVMMPLRPRRCDHFEMRLSGTGDVRIFSIAKVLEMGSDG